MTDMLKAVGWARLNSGLVWDIKGLGNLDLMFLCTSNFFLFDFLSCFLVCDTILYFISGDL